MKINAGTRISELLKAGDDMLDFIISLHPKFSKLSNPFLRRSIAPRVTVRDAARIAGMDVNDLLRKFADKGFEVEYEAVPAEPLVEENCDIYRQYKIIPVPAAKMLADKQDPFDTIRKTLLELRPGEAVEIILDFIPAPLIEIFGKQGYRHCIWFKDGLYHTFFFKPLPEKRGFWQRLKDWLTGRRKPAAAQAEAARPETNDFDDIRNRFAGRMEKVDVRDLEMPGPMMKIKEKLQTLPPDKALFVEHRRIPQFLIPELEKTGYRWVAKRINPDHTQLIIYKPAKND